MLWRENWLVGLGLSIFVAVSMVVMLPRGANSGLLLPMMHVLARKLEETGTVSDPRPLVAGTPAAAGEK